MINLQTFLDGVLSWKHLDIFSQLRIYLLPRLYRDMHTFQGLVPNLCACLSVSANAKLWLLSYVKIRFLCIWCWVFMSVLHWGPSNLVAGMQPCPNWTALTDKWCRWKLIELGEETFIEFKVWIFDFSPGNVSVQTFLRHGEHLLDSQASAIWRHEVSRASWHWQSNRWKFLNVGAKAFLHHLREKPQQLLWITGFLVTIPAPDCADVCTGAADGF